MSQDDSALSIHERGFREERRFARRAVLQFLYQADQQGTWDEVECALGFLREQLPELMDVPRGKAFGRGWRYTCEVVRGICAGRDRLDRELGACATNWTVERMSVIDRNILRLAAYELSVGEGIPPVTAIDEAVELAKEFGHKDSPRFVNGVLDSFLHRMQAREARSAPPADSTNGKNA